MADNTIIRPPQPKYGINEVVYLKESALLGFLEPAKVFRMRYDPDYKGYIYTFVYKRSKRRPQIAGDAIDLRSDKTIELSEDNLLTYVDALELKVTFLRSELAKAESQLASAQS